MKSEFKKFCALVSRNIKCYFKDKFLFFVSLITPMILLVLFATFLRSVYLSSFDSIFRLCGFVLKDRRVEEGLAGAWLLSSILSVSSVTVAVCSNAVMINDKIENSLNDFLVTPVKGATLSLSYFVANFIVNTIIMLVVLLIGFIYLAAVRHTSCGSFRKFHFHAGRAFCAFDVGFFAVRLYLRRVYASFAVRGGSKEFPLLSARHL